MTPLSKKILITGANGFTGKHLSDYLTNTAGFTVKKLQSDLCHDEKLNNEILKSNPDYILHLAGISFAAEQNISETYRVNIEGTINLLNSILQLKISPKKIIITSSATVYGNQHNNSILDETLCPNPVNNYGCSKFCMEQMAKSYSSLNILITRPFNYSGVGQSEIFLLPKIVRAYKDKKNEVKLGNLDVAREFNDIRDICKIYHDLMLTEKQSDVVNICSGKSITLKQIMEIMNDITNHEVTPLSTNKFIRKNEIKNLSGCTKKLKNLIDLSFQYNIRDTLSWMYHSGLDI